MQDFPRHRSERRRLKVLHVTTSVETTGSPPPALAARLDREGYEVHFAGPDGYEVCRAAESCYRARPPRSVEKTASPSKLMSLWRLYRLMRRRRFDIVHVQTAAASVAGRIAARLAGVPVVIITAQWSYFDDGGRRRARPHLKWLERLLGHLTDMLMTQSLEDAITAIRGRLWSREKVRWIGHGVETRCFGGPAIGVRKALGLEGRHKVVGLVGSLVAREGVADLVRAMRLVCRDVPEARLLLVEDTVDDHQDDHHDGAQEALQGLICESGLGEKVVVGGLVSDVPSLMSLIDLLVAPSRHRAMPRRIVEAMASGKPVVAADIPGGREAVVHGRTGLLVPVDNPSALAAAITKVLSDDGLGERMGEAGRRRALELFDERSVLDREMRIYRELAHERLAFR